MAGIGEITIRVPWEELQAGPIGEYIEVIDIEVNPRTYLVDRMAIRYSDKSSTEFIFMQIEINSRIPDSKFEFTPPAGIRVVKGAGIQ